MSVSAVIPTYNRARLIGETIDSMLAQSIPPAEIIVVDDGSTDDTEAVVRRYGSAVRYIRVANAGAPNARNVGAAAATQRWIAFCDSDDLWTPGKLECQLRLFEKVPELEFSFTDFVLFTGNEWESRAKFERAPSGYWEPGRQAVEPDLFVYDQPLYERIIRFQPVFQSTIMMSKAFFERVGGYDAAFGRTLSEDLEFTLRCVSNAPAGVIGKPLAGIRRHVGNFSGNQLRCTMGEIEILRYSRSHHPAAMTCLATLDDEILVRTIDAAEAAFALSDLKLTRELCAQIPPHRLGGRLRVKQMVSNLPSPFASAACRFLLALSNLRA